MSSDVLFRRFLMPQKQHTNESREFVIKFLKVCTNTENVAPFRTEIIRVSLNIWWITYTFLKMPSSLSIHFITQALC